MLDLRPTLTSSNMAKNFTVFVRGEGIDALVEGDPRPAVGFFTTSVVTAKDQHEAVQAALRVIRDEWSCGARAASNRGNEPDLFVESVEKVGLLGRLKPKRYGYVFFPSDDKG
jgi:hypothetical protein